MFHRVHGPAALLLLAIGCDVAPRAGPGLPGGPLPPIAAHPVGKAHALVIGPAGDSLTFAGTSGQVTLTVPPGALASDVDFTITEVAPNTAVGGTGSAFDIEPAAPALLAPVTLTFTPADASPIPGLTASRLSGLGYWFRVYSVARTATTITASTMALGTWTLVTLSTSQDLQGPFRLDSTTQELPFTATGEVTLQYVGSEGAGGGAAPDFTYFVPVGTVTPTAAGCDPVPASDLPWSLAEIHLNDPPELQFRWAILGDWVLTCGSTHPFVSTGFDTMGIYNIRCARSYSTASGLPVVIDTTHLEGQYVIDCGLAGKVTASWDLRLPGGGAPDPLPPP